jgi:hypothetical protein
MRGNKKIFTGKEEPIERVVDELDVSVLLPLSGCIHRESTEKPFALS